MKKSEAVKILLKHSLALVNEEQALHTIEILEKYVGMIPPKIKVHREPLWDDDPKDGYEAYSNEWELEDE